MIIYLLKTIACAAILLAAYKLLLENAKLNRFKRYFLLCCLLLSFVLPLLEFTAQAVSSSDAVAVFISESVLHKDGAYSGGVNNDFLDYSNGLLLIYCGITVFLLFRCFKNIRTLLKRSSNDPVMQYMGIPVFCSDDAIVPYSFGNRIFVSAESFRNNSIDDRIFCHEAAHVLQKHTWDIVFIELLRAAAWFNPILYGYKKAIQLNHEFLADEAVLNKHTEPTAYLQLLLQHTASYTNLPLSSSFNFLTTKKRFSMITQKTSLNAAILKTAIIILITSVCVYIFPQRSIAQKRGEDNRIGVMVLPQVQEQGVSKELMDEAIVSIKPYVRYEDGHIKVINMKVPDSVIRRLGDIYMMMNSTQRNQVPFGIEKSPPPFAKDVPSTQQLNSFKNSKVYGVWVDGKKVKNDFLNNYISADFSHTFISKLYGKAKENVSYQYQVDLMTNDYYKAYYEKAVADTAKYIMLIRTVNKK